MTKISLQYDRTELESYTLNLKNGLSNNLNATTISEVSVAPVYTSCDNKKVGNIEFNYMIVQNNNNQTSTVSENIIISFADCANSSIYAINKYISPNTQGSYQTGKEYKFRIVSGTGQNVKAKGWIIIKADVDLRHIIIKLE